MAETLNERKKRVVGELEALAAAYPGPENENFRFRCDIHIAFVNGAISPHVVNIAEKFIDSAKDPSFVKRINTTRPQHPLPEGWKTHDRAREAGTDADVVIIGIDPVTHEPIWGRPGDTVETADDAEIDWDEVSRGFEKKPEADLPTPENLSTPESSETYEWSESPLLNKGGDGTKPPPETPPPPPPGARAEASGDTPPGSPREDGGAPKTDLTVKVEVAGGDKGSTPTSTLKPADASLPTPKSMSGEEGDRPVSTPPKKPVEPEPGASATEWDAFYKDRALYYAYHQKRLREEKEEKQREEEQNRPLVDRLPAHDDILPTPKSVARDEAPASVVPPPAAAATPGGDADEAEAEDESKGFWSWLYKTRAYRKADATANKAADTINNSFDSAVNWAKGLLGFGGKTPESTKTPDPAPAPAEGPRTPPPVRSKRPPAAPTPLSADGPFPLPVPKAGGGLDLLISSVVEESKREAEAAAPKVYPPPPLTPSFPMAPGLPAPLPLPMAPGLPLPFSLPVSAPTPAAGFGSGTPAPSPPGPPPLPTPAATGGGGGAPPPPTSVSAPAGGDSPDDKPKSLLENLKAFLNGLFSNKEKVEKAQEKVAAAQTALHQAHAEVLRAPWDVQKAETKVESARAKLEAARASGEGVDEAQAELDKEAAKLETAKARRDEAPKHVAKASRELKEAEHGLERAEKPVTGKMTGKERMAGVAAGAQQALDGLDQSITGGKMQDHVAGGAAVVGGTVTAVGGALGFAAAGPVGLAIGAFGAAVGATIATVEKWSNSLHDANMKFSEFSAAMATVKAGKEVRDIMLSQERGERRAGSAQFLAEAISERERAFAPMEDAFSNAYSNILGIFNLGLATLMKPLNSLAESVGILEKKSETWDQKYGGQEFSREIYDIMQSEYKNMGGPGGRPPRFPRP